MNKLTVKEIIEIVKENDYSVKDFAYGFFEPSQNFLDNHLSSETRFKLDSHNITNSQYPYKEIQKEWLNYIGISEFEEIDKYGGEGKGELWYSVKYFKEHDVYIKTIGHYQSYHGVEFYHGYGEEVFPVTKTITVYE